MIPTRFLPSKFALLRHSSRVRPVAFCQIHQQALHTTNPTNYPQRIPLKKKKNPVTAQKTSSAKNVSIPSKLEKDEAGRRDATKSPNPIPTLLEPPEVQSNKKNTIEIVSIGESTKRSVARARKIRSHDTAESKGPNSKEAEDGKRKPLVSRKATASRTGDSKSTGRRKLKKSSLEQESTGTNSATVEDGKTSEPTTKSKGRSKKHAKANASTGSGAEAIGILNDGWLPKSGLLAEPLLTGSPDADRIAKHLHKSYYESKNKGKISGSLGPNRIHVVSKELCDDVLERLKPSLEKHIGCDIIDIHPGVGVWSSAIHEFLKPRTHILMEPEESAYKPLLEPLLDAKDSKCMLVPTSGLLWHHLQEILTPEYLPHQKELEPEDPRLLEPNNTLLVIANLGYYPKRSYRSFSSIATLVSHQLLAAARAHTLFHKYGQVRMIIWVAEDEKTVMLPRTISGRKRAAIEAEISCSEISEIASSTYVTNHGRREHKVELDSSRATLIRMEAASLKTPENRLKPLQIEGPRNDESVPDMTIKWSYLPELEALEKGYAAGEFKKYSDDPEVVAVLNRRSVYKKDFMTPEFIRFTILTRTEKSNKKLGKSWGIQSATELDSLRKRFAAGEFSKFIIPESELPNTKVRGAKWGHSREYKRLHLLRHRKRAHIARASIYEPLLEEYENIIAKQKEAISTSGSDSAILWEQVNTRNETFKETVAQLHVVKIKELQAQLDNRIAFYQDPPVLHWDRRKFEPLKVNATEFFPRHEMALIDFHPKPLWPILRENFPENFDVFEYILTYLFLVPKQSVREGLLGLYPGAYEWIEPRCPSLKDPNRGGNTDLDLLSVRCLNEAMLREIIEAWISWPFRPQRNELIRRMGIGVYDPDEEDVSRGLGEDE